MKRRNFSKALLVLALTGMMTVSCGTSANLPSAANLLTALASNPKMSQFMSLIEMAGGLNAILGGNKKSTLFVPTNSAFESLGMQTMKDITNPDNLTLLTNVLKGHVIGDALAPAALAKEDMLSNMRSKELSISGTEDNLMVGGAKVLESIKTPEGYIHLIDKVLKN